MPSSFCHAYDTCITCIVNIADVSSDIYRFLEYRAMKLPLYGADVHISMDGYGDYQENAVPMRKAIRCMPAT